MTSSCQEGCADQSDTPGLLVNLAALEVNAHGEQFRAVLASCCQPDLVAPNHRRGPPLVVNRRLPSDILGLAELGEESGLDGCSVSMGATKLVPIVLDSVCLREGSD
jgi:hypothetical protein